MRGKRARRKRIVARSGLIPAYAGKTCIWSLLTKPGRAHPRVCGENLEYAARRPNRAGSSPRVRGKQSRLGRLQRRWGLIPACAGKTWGWLGYVPRCGAHPRVCGENVALSCHFNQSPGSSPRVRGKLLWAVASLIFTRLIPACAGKTHYCEASEGRRGAHPRVCGENSHNMPPMCLMPGSSPRVRGKRICRCGGIGLVRLIPACAGKTSATDVRCLPPTAHPRVCGEN